MFCKFALPDLVTDKYLAKCGNDEAPYYAISINFPAPSFVLEPDVPLSTLCPNILSLFPSRNKKYQVWSPRNRTGEIIILCILIHIKQTHMEEERKKREEKLLWMVTGISQQMLKMFSNAYMDRSHNKLYHIFRGRGAVMNGWTGIKYAVVNGLFIFN